MATPDPLAFKVEVKDERIIIVPPQADAVQVEQIGKALVDAGQSGYVLKGVGAITQEVGTQRDPETRTLGLRMRLARDD